jgi:mannose/cellobiose epimerase-like protein (N-acyl-D-glucosamine 2-epimerase family)
MGARGDAARRRAWRWLALAGWLASAAGCAGARPPPSPLAQRPQGAVADLPAGGRWVEHLRTDLLPFWMVPDAWGSPRGSFPTYRCNDGRGFDPARPCKEIEQAPGWLKEGMSRQYVRMMSRQAFFYGVAYHLTGDPALLALAQDGVDYLRSHALEEETGSAASLLKDGERLGPPPLERTSQDLAYAQVGMAMYYYLTRDPEVLRDIERLKRHILGSYWDPGWGMLRWTVQGPERERKELVAQLDQVNAYLLLLAPCLPEPQRAEWQADLVRLATMMRDRYYDTEQHLYRGTLGAADGHQSGTRHDDFGHTAKALWMTERIGRLTGDEGLVAFATREAEQVLRRAQLPDGTWSSRPLASGLDAGKEWWIFAELDQLSATLALGDPAFARYLPRAYAFWLHRLVDRDGGEVWGWVDKDGKPSGDLKIHSWKSGYHSAEHALVAYLTTQALQGEPATLYYAFREPQEVVRPYLFAGQGEQVETAPLPGFPGRLRWKVTFFGVR